MNNIIKNGPKILRHTSPKKMHRCKKKKAYEKMLCIICYQGNANSNNETPLSQQESRTPKTSNAGENVEQQLSLIAGGKTIWWFLKQLNIL